MGEREVEMEMEMDDVAPDGTEVSFTPDQRQEPEVRKVPGFDYNVYATQKTIAKGLLDVALLANNAVQLKLTIEAGEDAKFYTLLLVLLPISMLLQVATGVLLLVLGQMKITTKSVQKRATAVNNATTGLVFFIVVINIIIASFSSAQNTSTSSSPTPTHPDP